MAAAPTSTNEPARIPYTLREDEEWWRDQGELLRRHGYELRPRFQPGWTPSWIKMKTSKPELCEDRYANGHTETIDARRISDGKRVKIKKLLKGSKEVEIACFLSSDGLRSDPRNHCVPILDVFSDEGDPLEFMVMPLLTRFDRPYFQSIEEAVDFMKQLLEGLTFMHEQGVAHRDCSVLNVMMDGEPLYPKGFHPSMPLLDANGKVAHPRRRRDVKGVKYYFTDFGISTRFDGSEETRLVTGQDGQDQDVPELRKRLPYDPFAVDVFILGNLFWDRFLKHYENLGFLKSLISKMTQQDPADRPSASDALTQFNELVQSQSLTSLRWALIHNGATRTWRLWYTFTSLSYEATIFTKSILRKKNR